MGGRDGRERLRGGGEGWGRGVGSEGVAVASDGAPHGLCTGRGKASESERVVGLACCTGGVARGRPEVPGSTGIRRIVWDS